MEWIEEFCPAKVNLFLAVIGRRSDGFHDLVSLMSPLDLGDRLRLRPAGGSEISFTCSDPSLPLGRDNLVQRAVEVFRQRHPFRQGLEIRLEKKVPAGAGLGGGSSDAAGLLLALNRLLGHPLAHGELHPLAAAIGSDCPFFLDRTSVVVRGRGEKIDPLPEAARGRLRGARLLLMKPSFSISTAWAYGEMARAGGSYLTAAEAEERIAVWVERNLPLKDLMFNNMEADVFRKFVPLPVMKEKLAQRGLAVSMSGSGSGLFALVQDDAQADAVREQVREAWGVAAWLAEARLQ